MLWVPITNAVGMLNNYINGDSHVSNRELMKKSSNIVLDYITELIALITFRLILIRLDLKFCSFPYKHDLEEPCPLSKVCFIIPSIPSLSKYQFLTCKAPKKQTTKLCLQKFEKLK